VRSTVEGPQRSEDIAGSAPLRRPSTTLRVVPLPQTSWGRSLDHPASAFSICAQ
jgi:hypothetical protein